MPDREALKPKLEDFTEPIWEQQKGETALWFGRFCRYRNMIGARSVLAAWSDEQHQKAKEGDRRAIISLKKAEKSGRKRLPGSWNDASKDWHWKERADARDRFYQAEDERLWLERQRAFRDQRWKWYESLTAKAEPMMRMPLVDQEVQRDDQGNAVTLIKATKWAQFRHAVFMIEAADRLGLGAIGDVNEAMRILTAKGFELVRPKLELLPEVEELSVDSYAIDFPDEDTHDPGPLWDGAEIPEEDL